MHDLFKAHEVFSSCAKSTHLAEVQPPEQLLQQDDVGTLGGSLPNEPYALSDIRVEIGAASKLSGSNFHHDILILLFQHHLYWRYGRVCVYADVCDEW